MKRLIQSSIALSVFLASAAMADKPMPCACTDLWAEKSPAGSQLIHTKEGTSCNYSSDYDAGFYKDILKDKDVSVLNYAEVEVPNGYDYQLLILKIPEMEGEEYAFACGYEQFDVDDEGNVILRTSLKAYSGSEGHVKACKKVLDNKGCK